VTNPYNHLEAARCVFVVGPLAIYVCEAPEKEIAEAMEKIQRLVYTAGRLLEEERDGPGK